MRYRPVSHVTTLSFCYYNSMTAVQKKKVTVCVRGYLQTDFGMPNVIVTVNFEPHFPLTPYYENNVLTQN